MGTGVCVEDVVMWDFGVGVVLRAVWGGKGRWMLGRRERGKKNRSWGNKVGDGACTGVMKTWKIRRPLAVLLLRPKPFP